MEVRKIDLNKLGFNNVKKDDKKVFLTLAANYGNIGDLAITIAQKAVIQDLFPDRKIVEIPESPKIGDLIYPTLYKDDIEKIKNDDDIVTIIGGGNMGNKYLDHEQSRRFIIELFKNNLTVSFPQSIDFSNDEEGKKEFQKSIDIYAQNKKLSISAREKRSYNIMKNNFKNNVYLVPDIVFYLKSKLGIQTNIERTNITLCLRNDGEKVTALNFDKEIENLLTKNNFDNIIKTDTHIGEVIIDPEERGEILENCLNKFRSSKLVITDRLHGMIFACITNTPCIALDNSNKKISETYKTWLENVQTIKLLENYDEEKMLEYVNELYNKNIESDFDFKENFEPLISALLRKQD